METIPTERLSANGEGIARAALLLRSGALVALPTETVYGLAADAKNDRAVARIFEAKGRPRFNPLIVHVADLETAQTLARFDPMALRLAEHFWPGPLTLVLPRQEAAPLSPLVSAGNPTVALRLPASALAKQVIRATGRPLAAPSANPSGQISPTEAAHVAQGLTGRIEAILDGGPCPVGLESTILATESGLRLLRPGGLSTEEIEAVAGQPVTAQTADPSRPEAPGQLASHYAPQARLRLAAPQAAPDEALLGFGPIQGDLNLSTSGDLIEAAANLFGHLHRLDRTHKKIAVAPIPDHGLGRAINDRLERAAAPRPPHSGT